MEESGGLSMVELVRRASDIEARLEGGLVISEMQMEQCRLIQILIRQYLMRQEL
jgi:hypothetical protein